ncbi:hypothetical protein PUNSTDRAFT_130031 [Punctularia strigosozonata HHB-11173 SS5]|uniref:uncharacterized protein n=1 Tax=Punctularia strigosozonata (strain HHB-11173) TaxID=741275 RepID=UPI0004416DFD|nr:uncharacterized protein PUNSTDRAFT_130031 [Punctularia strigosozonata HHB-11173 SS5]EIN14398.1 hypothetical protein PUNSTDRAFT_130031 [Punctularia strigosozonata HHB-11173 SS5]
MATRPTIMLNNYLQSQGKVDALVWVESKSGTPQSLVWTSSAKIDGQVMGTGSAPTKAAAKEEAARQALAALEQAHA